MNFIIILSAIFVAYFGLYWLISEEIKDHKYEIMNKLEWIEKQNNLLREEVNELRLQIDDMWTDVKQIKNNN